MLKNKMRFSRCFLIVLLVLVTFAEEDVEKKIEVKVAATEVAAEAAAVIDI